MRSCPFTKQRNESLKTILKEVGLDKCDTRNSIFGETLNRTLRIDVDTSNVFGRMSCSTEQRTCDIQF